MENFEEFEEKEVIDGESAGDSAENADYDRVSEENRLLRLRLECADCGVKKEYVEDVIRLAEGRCISDVIEKYPMFISAGNNIPDTGAYMRSDTGKTDNALRKAFGLK